MEKRSCFRGGRAGILPLPIMSSDRYHDGWRDRAALGFCCGARRLSFSNSTLVAAGLDSDTSDGVAESMMRLDGMGT